MAPVIFDKPTNDKSIGIISGQLELQESAEKYSFFSRTENTMDGINGSKLIPGSNQSFGE
jgi:hypothetical protein